MIRAALVFGRVSRSFGNTLLLNAAKYSVHPIPFHTSYQTNLSRLASTLPAYSRSKRILSKNFDHSTINVSRFIHTSQRLHVPPFLWLFVRPVAQVVAIFGGRYVRNWWRALKTEQRELFWKKFGKLFYSGLFAFLGGLGIYYYSHLQEAPFTKRKRFIAFNDEQFRKIVEYEKDAVARELQNRILPIEHPYTLLVAGVMRHLLEANRDIPQMPKKLFVCVVDDPQNRNALCLPTGHVIVFSGLFDTLETSHQLAAVLAHEMAHVVLGHSAEQVSLTQFIDYAIILVMTAIWAVMPGDGLALVTNYFYKKVMNIFFNLPYSRALEREADEVGLHLMAKACFDVREFARFWHLMHALEVYQLEAADANSAARDDSKPIDTSRPAENDVITAKSNKRNEQQLTATVPNNDFKSPANEKPDLPLSKDASHGPIAPGNESKASDPSVSIEVITNDTLNRDQLGKGEESRDVETEKVTEDQYKLLLHVRALFSTHPAHYHREEYINDQIPAALALRRACNCDEVPEEDPRNRPLKIVLTDNIRTGNI